MCAMYVHVYMASLLTRALIHSLLLNRPLSLSLSLSRWLSYAYLCLCFAC